MNIFTIGWIVIFTAGLLLEGVALVNKRKGDTLSEVTWHLMERRGFRVLLVMGLAWLCVHLLTKGFV